MKPRTEGAAWDLTPDAIPMVDSSDQTSSQEMDHRNPEHWGGNALGFNLEGRRVIEVPATEIDYDRKPTRVRDQIATTPSEKRDQE